MSFIDIGNPRRIKSILEGIVDQNGLDAIESEIAKNTQRLYDLSLQQYRFASSLGRRHWRQKVSRLYYSGYSCSKAIRYFVSGNHSTDVSDHKKVGELPENFPRRAVYSNKLSVLRDDRNKCDYDHYATAGSLIMPTKEYQELVRELLSDTKKYLLTRGITLRGRI